MAISKSVSNLPATPSRSGSPTTFTSDSDAFLAHLPTLQSEINDYSSQANSTGDVLTDYFNVAQEGRVTDLDVSRWDSGVTYSRFDPVIGSDKNVFRSLVDNNLGNDPVTDEYGNWVNLTALVLPEVLKPELLSPTDGETEIGETPTLDAGPYYSLYGKAHGLSRFQVSDTADFSNIVYDSGEIAATQTHDVPAGNLLEGVTYYWRAYYVDVDGAESEFSDAFGFTTTATFFNPEDPSNIGQAFAGGFLVGVIDTIAGTIDTQDDYQTGERYALIVAPKSLEEPPGLAWDPQQRAGEAGSITRWDGLSSTNNILAKNDTSYEVFEYIRSIRSSDPVPEDGGSDWYLPAMDELELIYRNLKPEDVNNSAFSSTRGFPGSQDSGFNPSSDPNGSDYTTSDPSQTSIVDFQVGGSEAVDLERYWSSTDADEPSGSLERSWQQIFMSSGFSGSGTQVAGGKQRTDSIRPVRRVPL